MLCCLCCRFVQLPRSLNVTLLLRNDWCLCRFDGRQMAVSAGEDKPQTKNHPYVPKSHGHKFFLSGVHGDFRFRSGISQPPTRNARCVSTSLLGRGGVLSPLSQARIPSTWNGSKHDMVWLGIRGSRRGSGEGLSPLFDLIRAVLTI